MAVDAWLPVGFDLPDGARSRTAIFEGSGWQILERHDGGRVLVASADLADRWIASGLVADGQLLSFSFGSNQFRAVSCDTYHLLSPVAECSSPASKTEALAFAHAFRSTRAIDKNSPLQDALYVERISRLLPTYSISPHVDDDVVLGYWLTGGASVSVKAFRRLHQILSWLSVSQLQEVLATAGFAEGEPKEQSGAAHNASALHSRQQATERHSSVELGSSQEKVFELPGRPALASFINEHIVEIVQNRERYRALGIDFPSAVVLHGPPGCGKTYAVERLIDYLGWPSYQIDASSVASPYIHETSRKVAQVFEKAIESAPSVLVIDEMEAFLADREVGTGHHRVEEVAEFLRRIPEAVKKDVLIVAMTNRVDMIDAAILRRGRFDHVLKVDYATEVEILALLEKLLSALPKAKDVDSHALARQLAGRPLSDVSFVVREAGRLAARAGKDSLDQDSLLAALRTTPERNVEGQSPKRRIGFY